MPLNKTRKLSLNTTLPKSNSYSSPVQADHTCTVGNRRTLQCHGCYGRSLVLEDEISSLTKMEVLSDVMHLKS